MKPETSTGWNPEHATLEIGMAPSIIEGAIALPESLKEGSSIILN
jgi:hypothetical protein